MVPTFLIFLATLLILAIQNNKIFVTASTSMSDWTNTCASGTSGDKIHLVKVGDRTVSPTNCTIRKGHEFMMTLDFSLDRMAQTLTLSCRGQLGFIPIPVLTATRDCNGVTMVAGSLPLQPQTEVGDIESMGSAGNFSVIGNETNNLRRSCSKLHPRTVYQFTTASRCPTWIPSITMDIACTCTNDQRRKTHCVNFSCSVHS